MRVDYFTAAPGAAHAMDALLSVKWILCFG